LIKKSALLLCTLLLPALSAAHAADPIDGRWKINNALSSWSNGMMPKAMNLTIDVEIVNDPQHSDLFRYHSSNITDTTHPLGASFDVPMDGKAHPVKDNPRFNSIQVRRIGPNQLEVLEMDYSDVVVGAWWWISPDGKQMIRRGIAHGADKVSHEFEEFFDRQESAASPFAPLDAKPITPTTKRKRRSKKPAPATTSPEPAPPYSPPNLPH
jgi:hypothetical protein